MRTTTKAQALEQFRYNWKASGTTDLVAKREAWGIFTDELCREGYVKTNGFGMFKLVNREQFSHANFNNGRFANV